MVHLTGLKIGESKLGLRLYWPVEMQKGDRKHLDRIVETQLHELQRESIGCYYDKSIANKYVTIVKTLAS